jgi:hypothetical protein
MGTRKRKLIMDETYNTEGKTGHVNVQEKHLQVDTQERINKSSYEGLVINVGYRFNLTH